MMRHLTEDELIKFEFDLSEDQADWISAHLDDCAECKEKLKQLKSRFASLDLLKEEMSVSDKLISQIIAETGKVKHGRIIPFGYRMWIGVAASILLMAGLFVVFQLDHRPDKSTEVAQIRGKTSEELLPKEGGTSLLIPDTVETKKVSGTFSLNPAKPFAKKTSPRDLHPVTAGDMLEEKPPFAPASAIELVVLPRRENVQLTIYNSADLTLVRERRNLTMKKGWNWLQFMWANTLIDPTSLTLEPQDHKGQIDVQQLVYPARLKDIGRWLIRSEVDGQVPFEITYLTSGLKWRAFYMGTLSEDEKKMHLAGHVRVDNNSGEDYEDAQTRLIVGKVNLQEEIAELAKRGYPYQKPRRDIILGRKFELSNRRADKMYYDTRVGLDIAGGTSLIYDFEEEGLAIKKVLKEGLSEYFLYTIEGTETIPNTWGKRLPSFEADDIPVESFYKYEDGRWNNRTIRFVKFTNDTDHELGETPIPEGNVRIYAQTDSDGHMSYVGGTDVKYIPVDDEVELNLGPARQVVAEPKLMNFVTANYRYDRKKEIAGWDEIRAWKITVTNARDITVKVEVKRNFDTTYWRIENTGESTLFEKEDADTVKYTLKLEPGSSKEIEYVLTTYHGTRRDDWTPTQ